MSKDFKEKYERVCAVKDKALGLVETQLNGDISHVDAKELGEVADIAKDMAELMKYCAEAEYYHDITEAMSEASKEDKKYYMDKYLPETAMYYTPVYYAQRRNPSNGRYMYTDPTWDNEEKYKDRMYYSSMNGNSGSRGYSRDYREGNSGMSRRTYMELKENGEDKDKTNKELEHYINDLSADMTEMIQKMDSSEKATLKQKLTTLAGKIV